MAPPKAHVVVQVALTTGVPPACTKGTPGVNGVGWGVHGCGVSTPWAAAVAVATAGFANEEHIPKGGTLSMPAESLIRASGLPSTSTWAAGSTDSVAGATPKEQVRVAVEATSGAGMSAPYDGNAEPRQAHGGGVAPLDARSAPSPCPDGFPIGRAPR